MKGLEAVELTLSHVRNVKNSTFRYDSEFYLKVYETVFQKLSRFNCKTISALKSWVTQGPNPIFVESGIPCLTGRNINSGRIIYENADYVSEEEFKAHINYKVQVGDILITLKGKGSIGKIAFVYDDRPAIFSRDIGIIRSNGINPSYLHVFLISKYGKLLVDRGETGGTGQSTLTTTHLKENILVPLLSIESEIERLHLKSEKLYSESNEIYSSSEELLLSTLGLLKWQPSQKNKVVKKLSDSFRRNGRIDAEYHQPKFDELLQIIRKNKHKPLGCIATFKKSIEPGSDAYQTEGIPFVRVSDLSKFELSQPEIHLDRNLFDIEDLKPKKDTILLSKDGSVGIAYKVERDLDIITSGALLHLALFDDEILPDYLTLVLNSKLTQMQAERDAGGSIIQHWRLDEIKQVLIPILPMDTQKELANQIQHSFKLRSESSRLIDIAKHALEIVIEQDEKTALKFIRDSVN